MIDRPFIGRVPHLFRADEAAPFASANCVLMRPCTALPPSNDTVFEGLGRCRAASLVVSTYNFSVSVHFWRGGFLFGKAISRTRMLFTGRKSLPHMASPGARPAIKDGLCPQLVGSPIGSPSPTNSPPGCSLYGSARQRGGELDGHSGATLALESQSDTGDSKRHGYAAKTKHSRTGLGQTKIVARLIARIDARTVARLSRIARAIA